ncbi:MAG: sugar phosphate isomerase/epimerase family protein [Bryobacteraceae bacterium]|nr:sugar phosphate isomerase/epimerase family protein [Bryobacteraceae bacterium]
MSTLGAMSALRHAICNEVFQGWDFADACRAIRKAGYTGIEIAPFTLAESPCDVAPPQRAEYRRIMAEAGLAFVGLHWLMVSPKGLHVTTPDPALRERSWNHIRHLIDLCADLMEGPGGLMIFGSPFQRGTTGGATRAEATQRYVDGLATVAPQAEARGVTILVEALPVGQCDVVNSLDEAAQIVDSINSPAIQTMFDTHNAVDETESHPVLIERHFPKIRHVHINEMDGRHPGTAGYDFATLFQTLERLRYQGWVSLEVFDFAPGAEKIAQDSLRYVESVSARG